MSQNRLILASASPRRIKLLEQIGITPSLVIPAMIDETPQKAERPSEFAKRMAIAKAIKSLFQTKMSIFWQQILLLLLEEPYFLKQKQKMMFVNLLQGLVEEIIVSMGEFV